MNLATEERYDRNIGVITPQNQQELSEKHVCIVGCGGLGGYAASFLARFGIGNLTLVDGDSFSSSNLNRQFFSAEDNIGLNKAVEGKRQLSRIASQLNIRALPIMIIAENAESILGHHDLVVDCLDNLPTRFLLEEYCEKLGIPLVHGAIGGWYGQVANIFPSDRLIEKIYPNHDKLETIEKKLGTPAFTPALVASLQASESIKILTGNPNAMRYSMLHIDLLYNDFTKISL